MNRFGFVAGLLAVLFLVLHLLWRFSLKHRYENKLKPGLQKAIHAVTFLLFILAALASVYTTANSLLSSMRSPLLEPLLFLGGVFFLYLIWRYITLSEVKGDDRKDSITPEVLLLAGWGVSVVWLAWAYYQSKCGVCLSANSGGFCSLVKDSASAFLPLITTAATAPTLLFWWLRRDRHKCLDLEHQSTRLLTERFSHAVELLGHKDTSVRLGAIYALERLARDSAADHWTVMETLAAYVRQHAPLNPAQTETPSGAEAEGETLNKENENRKPATDVQAALTVLGRRKKEHRESERWKEGQVLNLSYCNLRGADLSHHGEAGSPDGDGHFANAISSYSNFSHANFIKADLQGIFFNKANLSRAIIQEADLQVAHFNDVNLDRANLRAAKLQHANFSKCNMSDSLLQGADLQKAGFNETILKRAELSMTNLQRTNFWKADLDMADISGSNLMATRFWGGSNLRGANIESSIFNNETLLPFDEAEARRQRMIKVDAKGNPLSGWLRAAETPAPDESGDGTETEEK